MTTEKIVDLMVSIKLDVKEIPGAVPGVLLNLKDSFP
jgi:hypothetical protein